MEQPKKNNKNQKNQFQKVWPPKFNIIWIYIVLLGAIAYMWSSYDGGEPLKTEWFNVKEEMAASGDVEKIIYVSNQNRAEVYIKKDSLSKYAEMFGGKEPKFGPQFYFIVSSNFNPEEQFQSVREQLPEENRFDLETEERTNYFGKALEWLLFPLIIVALWIFMFRRMNKNMGGGGQGGSGGIFSVGKSQAKLFDKENNTKVTFKDVAGLEEAKVEVMEIVDFLKNPKKYTALGGKIPKGALLVGPPGTGKTLLAKAVAGEANVPFFSISGSDFVEMFVGVGASRVRDLFRQAKEKAPCIVFIDEIDAVGRARSKNAGFSSNDERENTLNQLLTEMDGFGSNSGVIILAATNRADILDKALMRAGRFDRQIHVDLPELKERVDIFKVHLRPLKLVEGFDIEFLAKQTPGFSGADIANVCNEAALIAARKNKEAIDKQDFLDAVDRIIGGLEKRSKIISPQEKRTIAFHEAGHATVSWILPHANPLLKVTIIPRGRALGAAWYLPEERQITTTEQLMDEMAATLGGRAAEEIINNKISTGALSDLEKITKQAYAMVSYLGMSKEIGNVSFYDSTESGGFNIGKPYSEKTAELIDAEVKKFVDEAYVLAKKVLNENLDGFTQLAEKLLEKEVIFAEDLEKIFGKRAGSQPPTITEQIEKAIENPEGKQETNEEKEQNPEEKTENE
ncbi:MAG: ATP-dependent zinc metalloprotease FtsH [Bacteroidales bacterium]|nr:ATP-dependent zinc metalloprotease FtsH [Bacteroidales bacterium]MDD3843253.1 ATP-dependent zinc metalloprotease FtsH [Bacteroidales bacterium]MDD4618456.1 ATP-dependent zinc metalloprotease FtsH [Bacteroidales bacterium]